MPQEPEILHDRGKNLEDEFFRREDQRLLARLKELRSAEMSREALSKASGITKPEVPRFPQHLANPQCGGSPDI